MSEAQLTRAQVAAMVACPVCAVLPGKICHGLHPAADRVSLWAPARLTNHQARVDAARAVIRRHRLGAPR